MFYRKLTVFLAALALISPSMSHASCGGCGRGESILSGVSGAGRFVSLDNLFTYNTITGLTATIGPGTPVTFDPANTLVHGTGISQLNATTFLITKTGHYFATFVATTATASLLGGVSYSLNGVTQGVNSSIVLGGVPLVLNQILNVTTVPTTLQVVGTGLVSLTLATGTTASLGIVQVNTP